MIVGEESSAAAQQPLAQPGGADERAWRLRVARRAALYLFLNTTSLSITLTSLAGQFLLKSCEAEGLDALHCKAGMPGFDRAQVVMAQVSSIRNFTMGVAQLLTCSLLGSVGDAYGRRLPILLPNVNSIIQNIVLAFCPWSQYLTVGLGITFLSSLMGSMFVVSHGVFAMLADATGDVPAKERARLFSLVESAVWTSLLVGPILGGFISTAIGARSTFLLAAGASCINMVVILGTFEETLEPSRRNPVKWQHANPVGGLHMFFKSRYFGLMGILVSAMLVAAGGGMAVTLPYVLRIDGSSTSFLGVLISFDALFSLVGLTFLMPLLLKHKSVSWIMVASTLGAAVSYLMKGLSTQVYQFFVLAPLLSVSCLFLPIVRTSVSHALGGQAYGEALAAIACLEQLSVLVASPLMNGIYGATVGVTIALPGGLGFHCIAFVVCSAICLIAACASAAIGTEAHPGATATSAIDEARA